MTTAIAPGVVTALRNLALDLKTVKKAGLPMDWAVAGRALESYDLRLEKAGYRQDGLTLVKLADEEGALYKGAGDVRAELVKLRNRVAELEAMAVPGGPARMATKRATPPAPTRADAYRARAEQTTDPVLRKGYWMLADKLDKERT